MLSGMELWLLITDHPSIFLVDQIGCPKPARFWITFFGMSDRNFMVEQLNLMVCRLLSPHHQVALPTPFKWHLNCIREHMLSKINH